MKAAYLTLTPEERGAAGRFLAAFSAALKGCSGDEVFLWAQAQGVRTLALAVQRRAHLLPSEAVGLAFTVVLAVWEGLPRMPVRERDLGVSADDVWVLRAFVDRVRGELGPLQGEDVWGPLPLLGHMRVQAVQS